VPDWNILHCAYHEVEMQDRSMSIASQVKTSLEDVRRVLSSEDRCDIIVESLMRGLDRLRALYRSSRSSFSQQDIAFLKQVRDVMHAIEEFEPARESAREVRTLDEYEDARAALTAIAERVRGAAVARRIERELADLIRREKTFSNSAAFAQPIKPSPLAKLEAQAPRCDCGEWMTLREYETGYFWGCSTFPQCWRKRRLTREEHSLLDPR